MRVRLGVLFRRSVAVTALLATTVAVAAAQSETHVRVLGGTSRFSGPMQSLDDLRRMVNANRSQITSVLATAGLSSISAQVLDALTTGRVAETRIVPGTHLDWMAFKRGGSPVVTYNARWVGRESFDAWELVVDAPGYTYTFVVPKVCGNLSLVSRSSSPVVAAPAPAPPPAPRAVPPPPPVAQAAPPPAPTPILSAAPWPPHDYFRWTATGFIGSYFAGGGNATQANDVNGSLTYGGEIGRMMWRHVGAEVLVDLAPKYKIESLALSEHPEVNSYMANAIGLWSTRFQDHFQPYVSGGVGGIQMHASVLPADALTGLTINSKVSDMIFGWNIGAGAYAFAGHSVGLRADVRWYKAADNSSFVGTPAENITHALVSGIDFWRANIGVAFRW